MQRLAWAGQAVRVGLAVALAACGARTGLAEPGDALPRPDAAVDVDAGSADAATALDASVEPLGCDGRPLPRPGSVAELPMPPRMRGVGVLIPDPLGLVVVGGQTALGEAADQMVFLDLVGGGSQELPVEGDPVLLPDREATAVYVPDRQRILVFGGTDVDGQATDQVFSFLGTGDVGGIRRVHAFRLPPFGPLRGACAIWDPVEARIIVHGGTGPDTDSTLQLRADDEGTDWSQILGPDESPPPGVRAMGYEPGRHRAIEVTDSEDGVGLAVYALSLDAGTEHWTRLGDIDFAPSTRGELLYDPAVCGFHLLSARRTRCVLEHWILVVGEDDVDVVYRGELDLSPAHFLAASTFVEDTLVVYGSEDCDADTPAPNLVAHRIALVR